MNLTTSDSTHATHALRVPPGASARVQPFCAAVAAPIALAAALILSASGAAAQSPGSRFANPAPGTLTLKLVIDGHFDQPCSFPSDGRCDGGAPGEKFQGTVHREVNGSTYLDVVSTAGQNPLGGTAGPPNEIEEMQKAVEACKGDQQCVMAVGMKMAGGMGGKGAASPMAIALNRYATWTTHGQLGRNCFSDGRAAVRESYTQVSLDPHEGHVDLATGHWTVEGSGAVPDAGSIGELCNSQVVIDTKAGTYDLLLELDPELELRTSGDRSPETRTERLLSGATGKLLVNDQKLGTSGTVISGSARFPAFFSMADGSKADAVVTWTFTPGTRKPQRPDPCKDDDFRDGPSDARSESVRQALAQALTAAGSTAGPGAVGIRQQSLLEFNVRLGRDHAVLPNRACLQKRIENGEVKEGTLEGASHLLVGAVQTDGGTTRVTVRVVDSATGDVVATGSADATGPGATSTAVHQAVGQLGWQSR
jgi:hypothetical protein